jgi:hypothetical protein
LFTLLSEGALVTRSVEIPHPAVEKALDTYLEWNSQGAERDVAMAAALVAARPYLMPTREEIEEAISDELDGEGFLPQFVAPKLARRVFDLLNSEPIRRDYTECPDEDCRSGGPHPISQDGTEMECRTCHVGFPNPFHATSGESGE